MFIITIIIITITFIQSIYNYIPETNLASRVYSVAAVLYVQIIYATRNVTCHVKYVFTFILMFSDVLVQCLIWLFSVVSWYRAFQVRFSGIFEWFRDCFSCLYCHWYHFCYIIIIIITNFIKTWVYLLYPSTSIFGFLLKCHLNVFSSDQTI